MNSFDHERLDVYQTAIKFVAVADTITSHLPRGRSHLADQLQRAAMSVPLNIAEGAGEFSRKEKARLYRIALRSATECAAIIDICNLLRLDDAAELESARQLLLRIVSMLTRMTKSGTGTGTGTGTKAATRAQSAIRNP
jgi:four helix bundle protein